MKNAFLTIALTTAMLAGSLVFTESAEARPRRYYGGPSSYYGDYYGGNYPRYYSRYYAPRYYGAPRYYAPRYYSYPYRYSYGYGPGAYFGGSRAGVYFRF